MVEGRPPYDRGSALATLTAVMTEDLETPEHAGPLLPVIQGLLEKDPAKRTDAATTRSMLRRIVADATSRAESTTQVTAPPADAPAPAPAGEKEKPRGISGLLGTVRVGSRAAQPEAPGAGDVSDAAVAGAGRSGAVGAAAPVAAAGAGTPGGPAGGYSEGTTGGARPVRRPVVIAAAVLVLLVLIAVVAVLLRNGDDKATTSSSSSSSSDVKTVAHSSAPVTPAPSTPKSAAPSPSPSPSAASSAPSSPEPSASSASPAAPSTPAAPATFAVPAGYHPYTDPSGFKVAVPDTMGDPTTGTDSKTFHGTDGTTLVIASTNKPGPSALGAWQSLEQQSTFTGYQKLRMVQQQFRSWPNAADWEFTFTGTRGGTMHALDRGFVTGKYGYAIYWTTLDSGWNSPDNVTARQVSYDSFQPAP
jgi:hypothetical protein